MRVDERNETLSKLKEKRRECEARFDAEARKRGFDPAQARNMAMPATLAGLFAEGEEIRAELEELGESITGE